MLWRHKFLPPCLSDQLVDAASFKQGTADTMSEKICTLLIISHFINTQSVVNGVFKSFARMKVLISQCKNTYFQVQVLRSRSYLSKLSVVRIMCLVLVLYYGLSLYYVTHALSLSRILLL